MAARGRSIRAKLIALGLGLALAALALALAEAFAHWRLKREEARFTGEIPYIFAFSETLGYTALPNVEARAHRAYDGQPLYDVVYRTDEHGRRITPQGSQSPERFAVFVGCSFTFGEGVAEDETLPAQYAEIAKDSRVYNYGFSGYGPQQLLAKLESGQLSDEISEAEGTLVYVFMSDHVRRAIGSMRVFSTWARHFPCYTMDEEGSLVLRGSFLTAKPRITNLYDLLKHDRLLPYLNVDLPLRVNEDHRRLTSSIVVNAKQVFAAQFPGSRFVVLLYPDGSGTRSESAAMADLLTRAQVEVIDLSRLFDLSDPEYYLAHDGHPNARAHAEVAKHLADRLCGS